MGERQSLCKLFIFPRKGANVASMMMQGPIPTYLDTVQLHHACDLHSAIHRHSDSLQLLLHRRMEDLPLLHPPEDVGEEVGSRSLFFRQRSIKTFSGPNCCFVVELCSALVPFVSLSTRPHAPEVLASMSYTSTLSLHLLKKGD